MRDELKSWEDSNESPQNDASSLVKPSGSLDSPVAYHLHQASYSTDYIENGETADWTNGCLAMVMGNGFVEGVSFVFDHLHRRHASSEGLQDYPDEVIDCHERFTQSLRDSMRAKVEIVYGAVIQSRMLSKGNHEYTALPLWGELQGILLVLSHESNYNNADERYKFRCAILFACHPQRLFYEPTDSIVPQKQDQLVYMASRMTRGRLPWIPNYFKERLWRSFMPSPGKLAERLALRIASEFANLQCPPTAIGGSRIQTSAELKLKCLRQMEKEQNEQLLQPVISWCMKCREKTRLYGSLRGCYYMDKSPRWTLGLRPLYLERQPGCRRCLELHKRVSWRFVPVDPNIRSIYHSHLNDFAKCYAHYDPLIIGLILDHWPASTKASREHVQRGDVVTALIPTVTAQDCDDTPPHNVRRRCDRCYMMEVKCKGDGFNPCVRCAKKGVKCNWPSAYGLRVLRKKGKLHYY